MATAQLVIVTEPTRVSKRLPTTGITPGAAAVMGVTFTSATGFEDMGPVGIGGAGGGVVGMGPAAALGAEGGGGGGGGGGAAADSAGFCTAGAAAAGLAGASPAHTHMIVKA